MIILPMNWSGRTPAVVVREVLKKIVNNLHAPADDLITIEQISNLATVLQQYSLENAIRTPPILKRKII